MDTWAGGAAAVQRSEELLRNRVDFYAYVSTVSVYGTLAPIPLTENTLRLDPAGSRHRRTLNEG